MFKKLKSLFVSLLLTVSLVCPVHAITWHTADQATVAWQKPATYSSGATIPDDVILEYEIFSALQADKSDAGEPIARTGNLQKVLTMTVEGKHYIGVRAVRVDNGEDVTYSEIAWSDNAVACQDGNTFGIVYFLVPNMPFGLIKQ